MELKFDRSFLKAIGKIKNKDLFKKVEALITVCEEAKTLKDIKGLKKLVGYSSYYRIKIGNYRAGIQFTDPDTIRL